MTSDVKGYVVRCEKESHRPGMPHEYIGHNATLGEAITDLYRALPHYDKGSIFRVDADGREERLPSLEEALAELRAEGSLHGERDPVHAEAGVFLTSLDGEGEQR